VQNWCANNFGPDTRVMGLGLKKIRPGPANSLGTIFIPLTDPWIQNSAQTHLLIEEKPTGSRVHIAISTPTQTEP
jgi:hypothetical protein